MNFKLFFFSKIDQIELNLIDSRFADNTIDEYGMLIRIFNSISVVNVRNNSFVNNSIRTNNYIYGSLIVLESPGIVKIMNNIFSKNAGILGTCIYYSDQGK